MKNEFQAVVIGGGVVGASVLYHLTKAGWKDVVLLERRELTAGSTWHAAGGMHTLNGDPNVARLQQYTINLYQEIEKVSGQSCSIHLCGGLMLADTEERMDFLRMAVARGRYLGMELEMITPSEARDIFPVMDPQYFVGALYDRVEGHVDPTGVTQAYVKCAQMAGAEVRLHTLVTGLSQRPDETWDVEIEGGDPIHAEHVVNAGGLWAREVGRMVGLELPVLAMEHQYVLTADVPEIKAFNESTGKELPMTIDFGGEIYVRQEGGGMLLGTYEQDARPWSPKVTPWDFGSQLLKPDLDRITPEMSVASKHIPSMATVGIKQVVNGPFTFAPDGNPLVGPIRGLPELLARVRGHGRPVAGRRRGARAGGLDVGRRRGRFGDGHLRHGHRPVRRLRQAGVHEREGPGELQAPLPDHLPERGAARRAAAPDHADLRPVDGRQRGLGRVARSRARALVPGGRSRRRRRT